MFTALEIYLSFLFVCYNLFRDKLYVFCSVDNDDKVKWDYVKHIQLGYHDYIACESLCRNDKKCIQWLLSSNEINEPNNMLIHLDDDVNRSNGNMSDVKYNASVSFDCYLLSRTMIRIENSLPSIFNDYSSSASSSSPSSSSSSSPQQIRGIKVFQHSRDGMSSNVRVSNSNQPFHPSWIDHRVQFKTLIEGTVVMDTSSLMNFAEHVVRGCSYTISLWMWLYKTKELKNRQHIKVFFQFTEIQPKTVNDSGWDLGLLTNAGSYENQNKFFFSGCRGKNDDDYLGIWRGGDIRYNEWIHIAITIEGSKLKLYIDGKYIDYIINPKWNATTDDQCVYDNNMIITKKDNVNINGNINVNPSTTTESSPTSSAIPTTIDQYNASLLANPWSAYPSNMILHLFGISGGRKSIPGMLHQVIMIRNYALTAEQVILLRDRTEPPLSYSFTKHMRQNKIINLEGFCPIDITYSFYVMWQWGLCPTWVCGEVCVNSHFYFYDHSRIGTGYCLNTDSNDCIVTKKRVWSITHGYQDRDPALNDIGYPTNAAPTSVEGDDGGVPSFETHTMLYDSIIKRMVSIVFDILNYITTVIDTITVWVSYHLSDEVYDLSPNYNEPAVFMKDLLNQTTENMSNYHRYRLLFRAIDWYNKSTEGKVQQLYKHAVRLMSSTNILQSCQYHNNDCSSFDDIEDRFIDGETNAMSALMLAMMMIEDIPNTGHPDDIPWSFSYTPLIAQPIHLALATHAINKASSLMIDDKEIDSFLHYHSKDINYNALLPALLLPTMNYSSSKLIDKIRQNISYRALAEANSNVNSETMPYLSGDIIASSSSSSSSSSPLSEYDKSDQVCTHHPYQNRSELYWLQVFSQLSFQNLSANDSTGSIQLLLQPLFACGLNESSLQYSDSNDAYSSSSDGDGVNAKDGKRVVMSDDEFSSFLNYNVIITTTTRNSISSRKRNNPKKNRVDNDGGIYNDHDHHDGDGDSVRFNDNVLTAENKQKERRDSFYKIAASYYFPVGQYVNVHFGAFHAGTGVLDDIRLIVTNGQTVGHHGESDTTHQYEEAEANNDNTQALTNMGRKYFWGYGGVQRNVLLARRFFERAAALRDPEGMFNLGVLYDNGHAGLTKNSTKAVEYFKKAANATKPFVKALYAVGQYYLNHPIDNNYTLAKEYFIKAAKANSEDAHFSIALMFLHGQGSSIDIPRCVAHMALSCSMGNVRAINFLSHALYDQTSWLAQYARERQIQLRQEAMLASILSPRPLSSLSSSSSSNYNDSLLSNTTQLPILNNNTITTNSSSSTMSEHNSSDSLLYASPFFTDFNYIRIFLSDGTLVPLPYPLGSDDGSCEAALPLLKLLSEMSYRTKDTTRNAIKEYIQGHDWNAIDSYEEASMLGVKSAQENLAYLYDKLISAPPMNDSNDIRRSDSYSYIDNSNSIINNGDSKSVADGDSNDVKRITGLIANIMSSTSSNTMITKARMFSNNNNYNDHDDNLRSHCTTYIQCYNAVLSYLSHRYWRKVAKKGEPIAMRKVADYLLQHSYSTLIQSNSGSSDDGSSTSRSRRSSDDAKLLYLMAGDKGDTQSLMQLGWMLFYGNKGEMIVMMVMVMVKAIMILMMLILM